MLQLSLFQCFMSERKGLTHQSISVIRHDVTEDARGSGLCNRTHITFITVKTGSPTKDPHSSAQTHRNAEKRGNILIRSCFLLGSWEGSIISCYASHLFYSMRTRDVPELVSLFPLRHVPRCHEKSMCDCCPGGKKIQGFHDDMTGHGAYITR